MSCNNCITSWKFADMRPSQSSDVGSAGKCFSIQKDISVKNMKFTSNLDNTSKPNSIEEGAELSHVNTELNSGGDEPKTNALESSD